MPDPIYNPYLGLPQPPSNQVTLPRQMKYPDQELNFPVEFDEQGNYFEVIPDIVMQDEENQLRDYLTTNFPFPDRQQEPELDFRKEMPIPGPGINPFISKTIPQDTKINPILSDDPRIKKNKFGIAEAYYAGKAGLDAVALFNNMIQPEPPSLQMKKPFFERMKLNPEQFDNMRSQMQDSSAQAYRYNRENVSQAADLQRGLTAVASGTQQQLMGVGMQQAAMDQTIQQQNQQIAAQETSMQTEIANQETAANYQIQQQAQMFKDQMVSAQLASLGDTSGAYSKYSIMKDYTEKQDELNKQASQINNELQGLLVENEMVTNALDSQDYKEYYGSQKSEQLKNIRNELLSDERYGELSSYYGGVAPDYSKWLYKQDSAEYQQKLQMLSKSKEFEQRYPTGEPKESDYGPTEWTNVWNDYTNLKAINDKIAADPSYRTIELENQYWKEALGKFDESSFRKTASEGYLTSRGLSPQSQLYSRIKSITDRTRQFPG